MMSASPEEPVEHHQVCVNPGNPVFSCMMTDTVKAGLVRPGARPQNPLYRTTYGDYGRVAPTSATRPSSFHPKSQKFTDHLSRFGMYRDNSLNTALDKEPTPYL